MPFADTQTGARLHYLDTGGDGAPVLLLHGLVGTASQDFSQVIEWLRPNFRVIGLTFRGYGYSGPKPRGFPPAFYDIDARDVVAFIEAVNLPKCHLIGYSDGGEAALIAAGYAPDRFLTVTTIGATGYLSPVSRDRVRVYPGEWITPELRQLHGIADVTEFTRQWTDSYQGMIDAGGNLSLCNAHRVKCPVLLILGDHDRLNPPEAAQVYIDRVPDGHLVVVPDCGHAVHEEQWDTFVAEIRAHFRRAGGLS